VRLLARRWFSTLLCAAASAYCCTMTARAALIATSVASSPVLPPATSPARTFSK